ncbi:MAG: hypothetical protein JNL02_05715 [Saprospiraceae bacterium]|nr:hypothetical protein [Saprospiraceae bacterium]MCC7506123.1 hypothetical protein [Saprospiraceae bacterium]
MKQNITPKSFLLIAAIVSCCSFLFVNIHAVLTTPVTTSAQIELPDQQNNTAVENDEEDARDIPLPDISLLERVVEVARKFAGKF